MKKRKFLKVTISAMLAVTMLMALCLPLYAEVPHYVDTIDTENNLFYSAEIDGSTSTGAVLAANAGTFVTVYDSSMPPAVSSIWVTTTITMYRDGEVIGEESASDVFVFSKYCIYIDQQTAWIVPDAIKPFDHVVTTHTVNKYDLETDQCEDELWSEMYVFSYADFLREI